MKHDSIVTNKRGKPMLLNTSDSFQLGRMVIDLEEDDTSSLSNHPPHLQSLLVDIQCGATFTEQPSYEMIH
jgi:hypothetical protein